MKIGILKEPNFENRVSALPEVVAEMIKLKNSVSVEDGAGNNAFADNIQYEKVGASIKSRGEILNESEIILCIQPVTIPIQNKIIIGTFQPYSNTEIIKQWNTQGNTVFSMDTIPRTTRAQSMDVLSSQANIAGYKAVLIAATEYCRYLPMFMTAAGSIAPAKVLILGAGVAGLQAIATAKRLGAVVEVFDTRPAVKEEVQSLGAKFIEVQGAADASSAGGYAVEQTEEYKQLQQQRITESAIKADIIITTAQIPGKKAPILITNDALENMRSGSIIIDLAAATGGNTNFTKNNETIIHNQIKIIGNSNLAALQPSDASKMYGKNILNFLKLFINKEGELTLNFDDDLVKGTCLVHQNTIINERMKPLLQ